MRKAINFDIDTKKYEEYTGKKAPTAYAEVKKFLKKNGFEHRQGSGYVSKNSLDDLRITAIITNMTLTLKWLRFCVKEIDVTNKGKGKISIPFNSEADLERIMEILDSLKKTE